MTVTAMHETGSGVCCPVLLISAPASGQGKTTVTAALARLHARQGRKVRVFKCGPDFLDPYWHELASGSPVHSVDLWMTGEADVRQRLHEAAQEADLILVEGVMGLFDGNFSAGDLAQLLGLPVLAVVDASAMAGTFGALAYGLQHYQGGLRWAGMLANRVATAHHADLLRQGLRDQSLWLGAMPGVQLGDAAVKAKSAALLPERHLGLIAAHELGDALERLDAAADALAQTPLGQRAWSSDDGQPSWQDWNVDFAAPDICADQPRVEPWLSGRRIAIARDAAFSLFIPPIWTVCVPWGPSCAFSRRWLAMRCRPAMRSGCPAAIRSCMPGPCMRTGRCATALPSIWRRASRSGPSAAACLPCVME